jgi:hypothetical protein
VPKKRVEKFWDWAMRERIPELFLVVAELALATFLALFLFVVYFIDWCLRTTK